MTQQRPDAGFRSGLTFKEFAFRRASVMRSSIGIALSRKRTKKRSLLERK